MEIEMFYEWIEGVLVNDEVSSDEEIKDYFIKEGNMSEKEADFYIKQRNKALFNPLGFKLIKYRRQNKMIDKIIRDENRKKMFESETDFIVDRCIFCESKNIIITNRFGNAFKCEDCGAEFTAQDIEKFISKGMIKEIKNGGEKQNGNSKKK